MSDRETRGRCPVCERVVALQLDGNLRKHRDATRRGCDGSEERAL